MSGRKYKIELVELVIKGEKVIAKPCTKCEEVKPLDMYNKANDGSAGGRNAICKECRKAYREANKESIQERHRRYYLDNYEDIRSKQAEYYIENREQIVRAQREWRADNIKNKAAYDKEYRKENKKIISERKRKWTLENIEKERERGRLKQLSRRATEKGLPSGFDKEWSKLLMEIYEGCILTGERDDIHWDHFIPLATGRGGTNPGNMVPLSATLNLRKGTKNPLQFLLEEEMSERRMYDILFVLGWLNGKSVDEYIDYVFDCFGEEVE